MTTAIRVRRKTWRSILKEIAMSVVWSGLKTEKEIESKVVIPNNTFPF